MEFLSKLDSNPGIHAQIWKECFESTHLQILSSILSMGKKLPNQDWQLVQIARERIRHFDRVKGNIRENLCEMIFKIRVYSSLSNNRQWTWRSFWKKGIMVNKLSFFYGEAAKKQNDTHAMFGIMNKYRKRKKYPCPCRSYRRKQFQAQASFK